MTAPAGPRLTPQPAPAAKGPRTGPLLICDLGGVLVEFSWARAVEHWATVSGQSAAAISAAFDPHDAAGRDFERGSLSDAAYFDHLRRRCHLALGDDAMVAGWDSIFTGVSVPVRALLEQAGAAGHRLVVASNTNAVHERYWRARFAEDLRVFAALYTSCAIGARKPEPAFFERVLEAEGARPEDAVFVDDTPANVEGARSLGLRAFHFTGPDELAEDLRLCGLL